MKKTHLLPLLVGAFLILGQGCNPATSTPEPSDITDGNGALEESDAMMKEEPDAAMDDQTTMEKEDEDNDAMMEGEKVEEDAMEKDAEEPASVSEATYEPFTQSAYDAAKAAGKPILLNFYANWCPTCRAQEPRTEALFTNKQAPKGIAAFRVNYNDSETDASEKAIAKAFGVTYQHTYVYFDADGNEAARTLGTTPDSTVLDNLNKIAP